MQTPVASQAKALRGDVTQSFTGSQYFGAQSSKSQTALQVTAARSAEADMHWPVSVISVGVAYIAGLWHEQSMLQNCQQYSIDLQSSHAGGGMFVGCVVAGSVMLCCQGAKVRGALIRDVAAYAIAVVAVAGILWSGKVIAICLSPRLHSS